MSINALSVANSILDEAERQGITVTPMQLQKLIYFANGWHMEITDGEPLVSDNFEAWQFGPVLPRVYHEFKRFGSRDITERSIFPFTENPWPCELSANQKSLVSEIVSIYGNLSGPRMSHLTHKEGTPWSTTWNGGVGSGNDIQPELILAEFRKIRNGESAAAG